MTGHPWRDAALSPDARARMVVAVMTEAEKFAWISGPIALPTATAPLPEGALGSAAYYPAIPRLGLPAIQQTDAGLGVTNPGGIRPGDDATALPSSLLLAASFDPETARQAGEVVGREARAKGFSVQLAGGANLVRDPRGGRSFEYASEDPLLTGVIVGNAVAGIQSARVVSTVKHFVLNAQETGRVVASSDLDEAAMRESDLLAFQIAIEIGRPGAVMPGYNLVNGTYAAENAFLLDTVLKGDWDFPGWAMSDWGGTHSADAAALAGLDVESAANLDREVYFGPSLRAAIAAGRVPQARVDDMLHRILRSLFAAGVIDDPPRPGGVIDFAAHRQVLQRAAERGIVLLKNDGVLPLRPGTARILVIGGKADQGVLAGGGSSQVMPLGSVVERGVFVAGREMPRIYHPSPPLAALRAEMGGARIAYLDGKDVAAATLAAGAAEAVVLFATEWRSEGLDADGLSLTHGQDALIDAVAAANPRTVVVLETGGPVAMPWLDDVAAVLAVFYPGSGGGPAIAGVLSGRVNPSGRLPLTFPAAEGQLPRPAQIDPATTTPVPELSGAYPVFHVDYGIEGSDVGYRWFLREGLTPLFPFGHGLSYTRFQRSGLVLEPGAGRLSVSFEVTNVGVRAGADVPQVYVAKPGPDGFVARLAGFARVELEPGARRVVTIALEPRLLARWDAARGGFRIDGGRYDVRVGAFAGDLAGLEGSVELGE